MSINYAFTRRYRDRFHFGECGFGMLESLSHQLL